VNRFVVLAVLTAAFAPAAVLGALPIVIPVVAGVTVVLSVLADRASPPAPVSARPTTVDDPPTAP
jgi:hypothetical protein